MKMLRAATLAMLSVMALPSLCGNPPQAPSATAKVVKAANAFLATLDADQRKRELFAFDDEQQRARWSNLPVSAVRRGGLSLAEMSASQRTAALAMLSSALSPKGYEKVMQIVESDEVLKNGSNNSGYGRDLYYFSILGTPSEKSPWMLQFGGHHLAVNLTVAGEKGILTPTLTGANPSLYTSNGKTVRLLAGESDKAIALLNALDEGQKKQAILNYRIGDFVLGPGQDGKKIVPEGLKASAMNERQKTMLLDLISEWAGIVHESAAATRMAEIRAGLDDTYFAWSGPTTVTPGRNISAYYRIQGPKLLIEYAPQAAANDPSMHIHAIYRDPTNDYGRSK